MKKNVLFVLLFLAFTLSASSQGWNGDVRAGFGYYNLYDVKALQLNLMKETNLTHVKPVEAFPGSLFYSVSANYSLNPRDRVGLDFNYYTTGGRNHVKDYSGEYKLDMILNGARIGAKYARFNRIYSKFYLGVQLSGGCIISNLDLDEYLKVYETTIADEEYKLTGVGIYVEPSVLLSYHLLENTHINLMGGYEQDIEGELHLRGNNDQKTGKNADWSGLRISLGVNYTFSLEKKGPEVNKQDQ